MIYSVIHYRLFQEVHMNKNNSILLEKHKDILSFRDLSLKTVADLIHWLKIVLHEIAVMLKSIWLV